MASGTVVRPLQIFMKSFSNQEVTLSSGINNVQSIDIGVSGYRPIGGRISGGSSVGMRNNTTLLGFNVSDHPQIYVRGDALEGTISIQVFYTENSSVITLS